MVRKPPHVRHRSGGVQQVVSHVRRFDAPGDYDFQLPNNRCDCLPEIFYSHPWPLHSSGTSQYAIVTICSRPSPCCVTPSASQAGSNSSYSRIDAVVSKGTVHQARGNFFRTLLQSFSGMNGAPGRTEAQKLRPISCVVALRHQPSGFHAYVRQDHSFFAEVVGVHVAELLRYLSLHHARQTKQVSVTMP